MLGSVEVRARSSARSSVLGSAEDWLGAEDSWFGLAWLRTQFGSLRSSWCLGSARDSARLGLEARPGSRLGPRLRDLRSAWSPARLISVRDFILNSLWFGSALAWISTRFGLVKSVDLLTRSLCFESTYYFAETVSVRCRLIVLQRRRASIRLPRLAVDDFNHTVTR